MRSPLEDTIWGPVYRSCARIQEAFDQIGPAYHAAIVASGVPREAARCLWPWLESDAQGVDFGCGSGVMGLALHATGLKRPLDGIDLSPGMLDLARQSGSYRELRQINLLIEPASQKILYDFAVTLGLIGDYVPYYVALPQITAAVEAEGILGFGIEPKSTPEYPLRRLIADLKLDVLSETVLPFRRIDWNWRRTIFSSRGEPDHHSARDLS